MINNCYCFVGCNGEVDVFQDLVIWIVVKIDCVEVDLQWFGGKVVGIWGVGNFVVFLEQFEYVFDVGECLVDFLIDNVQEIEWCVKLDQEGIDQYQVVDGYLVSYYVVGCLLYYCCDVEGDDCLLVEIKEGEGGLVVCCGIFLFEYLFVVVMGFLGFVVEIFDGFVVEQVVYCMGIGC